MDTKWKKSKAILGLLAFLLGASLVLEGALYFGTALTSSSSRRWMEDSFRTDWRDSGEFRGFVSASLERLIAMGAGGWPYQGYYWDDWGRPVSKTETERWARRVHQQWREDKNVLYTVEREGKVLYSSDETLSDARPEDLMERGYGFLLTFDGAKVRMWKDGKELDVYGGGYYRFDGENTDQWYVPGYENFTLDEAGSKVRVVMAVLDEPQVFFKGNYGSSGTKQYNQLYYVKQNLETYREAIIAHAVRLGVGLGLFLLYLLLRKDKKRADMALARWTGKLWFEVKALLAVLLVFFFLPRTEYLGDVWRELTYSYTPTSAISGDLQFNGDIAAELEEAGIRYEEWLAEQGYGYEYPIEQTASFGTAVTVLSENGGWLLREYLSELANHTANLLVLFWGFYLLVFNDWRYNKHPWRHGVFAALSAGELKYPLQKRLRRMNGFLGVVLLLLWLEVLSFMVAQTVKLYLPTWAIWNLLGLPWLLALVVFLWFVRRQRRLWIDFGAVADYAASLRAGTLEGELSLPEGSDLGTLADDLNHVREGLHQAVEERTRSERMKVELVTNVSHDLKTPLTSILSYAELLEQEGLEPPAGEYVKILGEKARRLRDMVRDVFEVSKAASGQLPVKLERLDLARLLRQTLADMDKEVRGSGLTLKTAIPEGEVPITADSDRLYRVFQNLIGNALKYSLPASRVYLTLTAEGGTARAVLQNTSARELDPDTDYAARFVRGDESRADGGSGLGLSIAGSFTRACGGELTISTQADLFTAAVTFPMEETS